jgi:hypothetical protein
VSDKLLAMEGRWLMGRVMPHELLKGIGEYVKLIAPGREDEIVDAIRARANEFAEQDKDMVVDPPSQGMLAVSAVVLAANEQLLPLFDGDKRRTLLFLQHVFGTILRRSLDIAVAALARCDDPLDAVDKACRKDFAMYGTYSTSTSSASTPRRSRCASTAASSATSSRVTTPSCSRPCCAPGTRTG